MDPRFAGRGVYVSRFRSDGGSRVLVALDRCGQLVVQAVVRDRATVNTVAGLLWTILDVVDPGLGLISFADPRPSD